MRIIIDMQACQNGSRFRGIGRYTLGMVTAFLDIAKNNHECHLLMNGMFQDNLADLIAYYSKCIPSQNIHIWQGLGPTEGCNSQNAQRKKISALLREQFIEKLKPDALFIPTFFEGFGDHTVLTIPKKRSYQIFATSHDLIPLVQSDIYLDPHPQFKKFYLNQVNEFKNCDGFLAVSESSKQELVKYIKVAKDKIVNTLEGIESQFTNSKPTKEQIEKLLNRQLKNRKIILYFGASDERKNHLKLIKAHSLLSPEARKKSILVLAGIGVKEHYEKFKDYASKCGLSPSEFCIIGRTTDKEVIDLYSYCYLFVFPSFHEGFGLPALEAMACGTAVITANTTSLPEVIGREDLTFDPYSSIEIKKSLEQMILDESFRNQAATYCLERSKQFSWNSSASIALKFIESQTLSCSRTKAKLTNLQLREQCLDHILKHKLSKNLSQYDKEMLTLSLIKNFREERKPRILFDISKLITLDFVTGIQRVTTEIIKQLNLHYANQFEIVPVKIHDESTIIEEVKDHHLSRKSTKQFSANELMDIRLGDIYINIDLDHSAFRKAKAYEHMRQMGCKTHFIVHDLLPIVLGDSFFSDGAAVAHFTWFKEAAKANALICISQSVMHHVDYYLNAVTEVNPELQLGWFHLGGDFSTPSSEKIAHSALKFKSINFNYPMFFMVGSVEPRKGHLEVIEAMIELWNQGFKGSLVIAGARGWNNELVSDLINSSPYKDKLLFWPEKVTDSDLAFLYSQSTVLIAASLGEGFGLPLIEAMHYKKAVIARDIPVFREVTQNSAEYFSTSEQLKSLILNFKSSPVVLDSKLHTWTESAHQLMDVILNNNYPITWKRDHKIKVLSISSGDFGTTCGINSKDRIKTTESAGLLLWGGYFALDQGTYHLEILGKSSHQQMIQFELIEIINGQAVRVYSKKALVLTASHNQYDIAETIGQLEINIPHNMHKAEIYIKVKEDNEFSISGFELVKISSVPQLVFDAGTENFQSEVGMQNEKGIFTQNTEGLLLKGGEINLSSGKYSLEIAGTSPLNQTLDVAIGYFDDFNTQQILLDFKDLKVTKSEDSIITKKTFLIETDIKDAAFFINVSENNKLKISEIKLQKI